MNGRYLAAVDWDGTCVEEKWPDMGDWLPGAQKGLKLLAEEGPIIIHTLRTSPVDLDGVTERDPADVDFEIYRIREKLEEIGLGDVPIWTAVGKPPAQFYIDDRALPFNPKNPGASWQRVLGRVVFR